MVNKQAGSFRSEIMQPTGIPKCKTHIVEGDRSDCMGTNHNNVNILEDFRLSANNEADKEASRSMTQKIHSKFSDVLSELDVLRVHSSRR